MKYKITILAFIAALIVVAMSCTMKKSTTGFINGHEYVDLGLSVKWAAMNVEASSPSGYGRYFAWGETCTKREYTEKNSKCYNNSSYCRDIGGDPSTDVARAYWGGSWRMPTKDEFDELLYECAWTVDIVMGRIGYCVTGPNGNSIFLPAAGYRRGSLLYQEDEYGYYWCSMPDEPGVVRTSDMNGNILSEDPAPFQLAYCLDLCTEEEWRYTSSRLLSDGLPVRPVSD